LNEINNVECVLFLILFFVLKLFLINPRDLYTVIPFAGIQFIVCNDVGIVDLIFFFFNVLLFKSILIITISIQFYIVE